MDFKKIGTLLERRIKGEAMCGDTTKFKEMQYRITVRTRYDGGRLEVQFLTLLSDPDNVKNVS